MAVDGVYDVSLEISRVGAIDTNRRRNVAADPPNTRPRLPPERLTVELRGEEIALAVAVSVERRGFAATDDPARALARIRDDIEARLRAHLAALPEGGHITPGGLLAVLAPREDYVVERIGYNAEFVEEGLRVVHSDRELVPTAGQVVSVRTVSVSEEQRS
jgi:hypothetical protein